VTDKGALERIEGLPPRPEGYAAAVRALLGHPGTRASELAATAARLEDLHAQGDALCGEWVAAPEPLPRSAARPARRNATNGMSHDY